MILFSWKCLRNTIQVKSLLKPKIVGIDEFCANCKNKIEVLLSMLYSTIILLELFDVNATLAYDTTTFRKMALWNGGMTHVAIQTYYQLVFSANLPNHGF